jgi:hypothetical protein
LGIDGANRTIVAPCGWVWELDGETEAGWLCRLAVMMRRKEDAWLRI